MLAEEIPVFQMARVCNWVYPLEYCSFLDSFRLKPERVEELDEVVEDLTGDWLMVKIVHNGHCLGLKGFAGCSTGLPLGEVVGSIRQAYIEFRTGRVGTCKFWPKTLGTSSAGVLCYRVWRERCSWGEGRQIVARVINESTE